VKNVKPNRKILLEEAVDNTRILVIITIHQQFQLREKFGIFVALIISLIM